MALPDLVTGARSDIIAVDCPTLKALWLSLSGCRARVMVLVGVVVGTSEGEFRPLRLADGKSEWGGQVKGQVAGIGGDESSLFIGTVNGTLYSYALPATAR